MVNAKDSTCVDDFEFRFTALTLCARVCLCVVWLLHKKMNFAKHFLPIDSIFYAYFPLCVKATVQTLYFLIVLCQIDLSHTEDR